jgi:hypothetical protein
MNELNKYIYSDLETNSTRLKAGQHPDTFKYNSENAEDLQFLKSVAVEEIELVRYSKGDSFGFDEQFREIVVENVLVSNKIVIAFIADFMLKPLSKLRSYKGILSKELKEKSQYIEQEIIIKGQSIIGNLLNVDNENVNIIVDNYFGSASTCCFIQSENPAIFQKEFLNELLENCMIHTQTSTINYFSLCKFLKEKEQIIRIGGDGYDNVSIQIFSVN